MFSNQCCVLASKPKAFNPFINPPLLSTLLPIPPPSPASSRAAEHLQIEKVESRYVLDPGIAIARQRRNRGHRKAQSKEKVDESSDREVSGAVIALPKMMTQTLFGPKLFLSVCLSVCLSESFNYGKF